MAGQSEQRERATGRLQPRHGRRPAAGYGDAGQTKHGERERESLHCTLHSAKVKSVMCTKRCRFAAGAGADGEGGRRAKAITREEGQGREQWSIALLLPLTSAQYISRLKGAVCLRNR